MKQTPAPGQHLLACCGDTLEFTLQLAGAEPGRAFLRTNIGHAAAARQAIIREVLEHQPRLAEDWFDLPMAPDARPSGGGFRIVLPLVEPGHFEAKAFFLPARSGQPQWPEGPNTVINVHPARYAGGNSLYNAFVRMFGEKKLESADLPAARAKAIAALDERNYAVIPPSGTFRDLIRELDFIVHRLHCRIILLLPIHPTPTVYGRMGRFGSPYAALDFMDADPALAEFDPRATPLEQFEELADGIHARGARLFLDIAINHTGWAAKIHGLHPDWLKREADGTIRSPGAWGVVWRDLTELDHARDDLWKYLAEVFLAWCRRGVDGFRCDAGYMIPVAAWEFIVAIVRREFPATVFLLEGLGGKIETTTALLDVANLNWAYSELFQNYDRRQLEAYLPFAIRESESNGLLVHFAETHDNPRLAARSLPFARMRTALAALCSVRGAFGFANGVEWFAAEKIDVHERSALNWDSRENQVAEIARLNALLGVHPAFSGGARLRMIQRGAGNAIALLRQPAAAGASLLVLANLDDAKANAVAWNVQEAGLPADALLDLLSGKKISAAVEGERAGITLAPGEVLCLSADQRDLDRLRAAENDCAALEEPAWKQGLRAWALEACSVVRGAGDVADLDPDRLAAELAADPRGFCRRLMASAHCAEVGSATHPQPLQGGEQGAAPIPSPEGRPDSASASGRDGSARQTSPSGPKDEFDPHGGGVVSWEWPRDLRREVMLPPRHFLVIAAPAPFRVQVAEGDRVWRQADALPRADSSGRSPERAASGRYFALLPPLPAPAAPRAYALRFAVYQGEKTEHATGHLLALPDGKGALAPMAFARQDLLDKHQLVLGANQRGGMLRAGVVWAELRSRYDALLAGNLSPDYPEDRRIMLTRCRAWLVYHGYSQDITVDREQLFVRGVNGGLWRFRVPFGHGRLVWFDISAEMVPGRNAVRLSFVRRPAVPGQDCLADELPVTLIVRPDIEDRNFHADTKAYLGPEKAWPAAIRPDGPGFTFAPDPDRQLKLTASAGQFQVEPEWQYMVHHPLEAERGLPADSDLFSPGYFRLPLAGGEEAVIMAQILTPAEREPLPAVVRRKIEAPATEPRPLLDVLERAMRQFIVRRDDLKTVIAGYPWFLDWGRDTLICARGLLAAGLQEEVGAILREFARFEKDGTLPNMIQGGRADNRDTSDAPLWLITACADACRAAGHRHLLDQDCGRRTVRQALVSIARGYMRGTPNGIRMDPDSGLIFSPAHFTWMDTNFPAGSPREGYPIEIQALWHAALAFLAEDDPPPWRELAGRVENSLRRFFWNPARKYCSDCLHAAPGVGAAQAAPDDALRPNQLLALTLGAVPDAELGRQILDACEELLVPGAIRTLADRPVEFPLPVNRDGRLLNDPLHPYWGRYEGDEDTRRKPAYHNGTAWTWLFPSFCEAWVRVYGAGGRDAARAWLAGGVRLISAGCLGQIPEILDGDYPHRPRGCDAQAWGVTELYRVLKLILATDETRIEH